VLLYCDVVIGLVLAMLVHTRLVIYQLEINFRPLVVTFEEDLA